MKHRISSLRHALRGIAHVLKTETNFKLMVLAGIVAIAAAIYLPLSDWQRILIILLVTAVLTLEMLNTALERVSDALKPRLHPMVKDVKDIMAGAVLLASISAAAVGIMIFWTYFRDFLLVTIESF